jgi:hypothetical protein
MISRSWASRSAVLGAGLLLSVGSAGVAVAGGIQDPLPIGQNQYFSGLVNGQSTNAAIRTDCTGPITPNGKGHPIANQSVEAVQGTASSATSGYTGATRTLLVTLGAPVSSTNAGVIGTTTSYYAPLAVPTTLTVPCSGSGTVTFTPQPLSSPARPATVTVVFLPQP